MEKMKFEWVTKKRGTETNGAGDVYVSIVSNTGNYKSGDPRKAISFTFRNDTSLLISDTDYFVFAVKKTRIYFAKSDNIRGFKLAGNGGKNSKYAKTTIEPGREELYTPFLGDHELKYDDFNELYYIEREEY